MKSLRCAIVLVAFALTLGLNATAAQIAIASYDITETPQSGFGCWAHTYNGQITDLGRTVSGLGSCTPNGTHLASYTGGSGTLNDGFLSSITSDNHLLYIGLADDSLPVFPVITLHLVTPSTINAINVFGGYGQIFGPQGALSGVRVEIEGQSVALSVTPAGSPDALGIYRDGTINLVGTPLANIPTSTIVLRDFTAIFFGSPLDFFSLTEITLDGTPTIATVNIDIYPNNARNRSELDDPIPVAILSSRDFNALTGVKRSSLTFGKLGTEASLIGCLSQGRDVNGDGWVDLVCTFSPSKTGLKRGDTSAALMGTTTSGGRIRGQDMISIQD